jgi:hypothetical protein
LQNAHTSPHRGRSARTTTSWSPATITGFMDSPRAGSRYDDDRPIASRSARAIISGCIIEIGGLAVSVRASDAARAQPIARMLAHAPDHRGPPQLQISFGEHAPPVPMRAPDAAYDRLSIWREGERAAFRYGETVSALAHSGGVEVGGGGSDLDDAWRLIFHFAMPHALALHDRFVVHGAAVERHRRAVLAFGGSGAGKSTLVLAAVRAGWAAMADDLVVLRGTADGAEACGIAKPFRVPVDVAPGAGSQEARPAAGGRPRWLVASQPWERGWHPVGAAIVVGHASGARAELDRASGATIVDHALGAFVASPEPVLLRRFLAVAAAVGRLPGWQLGHAGNASTRLEECGAALDRISEGET